MNDFLTERGIVHNCTVHLCMVMSIMGWQKGLIVQYIADYAMVRMMMLPVKGSIVEHSNVGIDSGVL